MYYKWYFKGKRPNHFSCQILLGLIKTIPSFEYRWVCNTVNKINIFKQNFRAELVSASTGSCKTRCIEFEVIMYYIQMSRCNVSKCLCLLTFRFRVNFVRLHWSLSFFSCLWKKPCEFRPTIHKLFQFFARWVFS